MRSAALVAILLAPSLAAAGPKFFTTVAGDERPVVDAIAKVRPRLDACWRQDARITLRLTVDKGAVKAVEFVEGDEKGPMKCLTKALRRVKIADKPSGAYEIQLSNLNLEELAKNGSIGTMITSGSNGSGGGTGRVVASGKVGSNRGAGSAAANAGGLSTDDINRVIIARAGVFRACYQKEVREHPKLAGKVIIRFEIRPDGAVKKASISSSTLASKAVENCLTANILRLKFPTSSETSNVTYPFLYSKG